MARCLILSDQIFRKLRKNGDNTAPLWLGTGRPRLRGTPSLFLFFFATTVHYCRKLPLLFPIHTVLEYFLCARLATNNIHYIVLYMVAASFGQLVLAEQVYLL